MNDKETIEKLKRDVDHLRRMVGLVIYSLETSGCMRFVCNDKPVNLVKKEDLEKIVGAKVECIVTKNPPWQKKKLNG